MEINNLISNLQKVKDEGQKNIDIVIGHEDNDLFATYDYEIHGEEGVREIFVNVGFDSKITNPEEPKIRCNNCMTTFRSDDELLDYHTLSDGIHKVCPKCKKDSYLMQPYLPIINKDDDILKLSPIKIINKINQLPGFTARGIIAVGNIESVLVEDDAKQVVIVPNKDIGQWFLDNLAEDDRERRIEKVIPQKILKEVIPQKILKEGIYMQGYYTHLTNKEIPYGTLFEKEDGDWLRPFKPKTETVVQSKDLYIIERPDRKDFTKQCEVCGGDCLMWRFTDGDNNANNDYYDCWDSAVHAFLYAIMNDPSGNFSVYAKGRCNCGHTEYDEGVLYNDRAGEDLEESEKKEQEEKPWFDRNV